MAELPRETLERWYKEAGDAFNDWEHYRKSYDLLVQRQFSPNVDARLGIDTAEYQTPALEKAEMDYVDILCMNRPRFAGVPGAGGVHTADAMRDGVLWAARSWEDENHGGWLTRAIAQGQVRYGGKFLRMLHHPIEEPEGEDREEAMKNRPHPWYFESLPDVSCKMLERNGKPQAFFVEMSIPVLSAKESYAVDGERIGQKKGKKYSPTVLADGKLGWLGDGEEPEKETWQRNIKALIVEYLDWNQRCPVCPDKHPLWCGMELVSADGNWSKGEVVNYYTLPYKHAPTIRFVPGRVTNATNPHWKYRPMAFELYVEATIINWCHSVLMTLGSRDSSMTQVYGVLSSMPDQVAARIPQEFWDTMSIPLPDPNEIAVSPVKLEAWPVQLAPIFLEVLTKAEERFYRAMPNRWLTGEAQQEAATATGTAVALQTQQAALPFDWPLTQKDTFIRQAKEDQLHAMRYWDHVEDKDTEQKYFATVTADLPVKGLTPEEGEQVYMSASKAAYAFTLTLATPNETLQEQVARQQMAWQNYEKGAITSEQLVEQLGYHDTKAQLVKLRTEYLRRLAEPMIKTQLQMATLKFLTEQMAQIDPMLAQYFGQVMNPMQQQAPSGAMGQPPMGWGDSSVRLPALNGVSGGSQMVGGVA